MKKHGARARALARVFAHLSNGPFVHPERMEVNQPRVARATLGLRPPNLSPTLAGLHQRHVPAPVTQPLQGCSVITPPTQGSVSATQPWAGLSESFQDSKDCRPKLWRKVRRERRAPRASCQLALAIICTALLFLSHTSPALAASQSNVIAKIESLGGTVRWLSTASNAVEADFQFNGAALKDESLAALAPLSQLTVLRLKNTSVTDTGFVHLAALTNLQRLDLSGTAITDAGLKHLVPLQQLAMLNLFRTGITDAGLAALQELPALQQVFLGETKVSADAIARWQKARPALRVIPDPAADREHARLVVETTVAAVQHAEEALPPARKKAEETAAKAAQLKKEFEEATKRAEQTPPDSAARKEADKRKTAAHEASEKAVERAAKAKDGVASAELGIVSARQQAEEARRDLAKFSTAPSTNPPAKP